MDGECSHEIKTCLLLGRKAMTNLDSVLKSRDIILPTKARLVKSMVFPVVMYGYESWTIKKAEHRRINAFKLGCWRRLLRACPPQREKKELAKIFQALRIEINQEVEALKEMLVSAKDLLKPGGRLVVITYHSIEDRIVKNFMKSGNFDGVVEKDFFGRSTSPFEMKKVIVPTDEELEANPRSRSAKLRIGIKLDNAQK